MMKMIFMGPNCPRPSLLRWFNAMPSLMTKTAQTQQMLMVKAMFEALLSQWSENSLWAKTMALAFWMQRARRNPIAMNAVKIVKTETASR